MQTQKERQQKSIVAVSLILKPSDAFHIGVARELSLSIFKKFNNIKQTTVVQRLVPEWSLKKSDKDYSIAIKGLVRTGYRIHCEANILASRADLLKKALRSVKTKDGKHKITQIELHIVK